MILAALGGCALFKLREDVKISKDSCLLFGEVLHPSKLKSPLSWSPTAGPAKPSRSPIMPYCRSLGQYELLVQEGSYEIFAFEDLNGSLSYDPGVNRPAFTGSPMG